MSLRLLVGLGNPGAEYAKTRHNVGFWWLDQLAQQENLVFSFKNKFHGDVAQWQNIWLLKPTTYMNKSGIAINSIANFYNIKPQEILVIHDELDLPVGTVKLKKTGGHGGHNGLRDTIAHLNSKDFMRLRIGIGHPGNKSQVLNYVLHTPSIADIQALEESINKSFEVLELLLKDEIERAMQQLHS